MNTDALASKELWLLVLNANKLPVYYGVFATRDDALGYAQASMDPDAPMLEWIHNWMLGCTIARLEGGVVWTVRAVPNKLTNPEVVP